MSSIMHNIYIYIYIYCILGEYMYIVACIPSTFCPTLGHHQGRIYYKSDVKHITTGKGVFAVDCLM